MNQIDLLHRIAIVPLALAAFWPLAARADSRPPNIIVFLVDDYDKPETSVYGGNVLTPNLDRLAREGMTMTNAHMTSTVCTPSRYTCLTGRYAGSSTSAYYLNECPPGEQGLPAFNVELEPDNMNVGQVLQNHGYATGFVGKYHVGPHIDAENAAEFGWKYFPKGAAYTDEIDRMKRYNHQRACQLVRERGFTWVENIYWENTKAPFKGHNPEWTIDAALRFIDQHKEGPFYLHYATTLLHGPNGEWFRSLGKPLVTDEGMLDGPIGLMDRESVMQRITKAGLTEMEAGYLWMDDSLGLLLDRLDQYGITDNTIVLFLADHGSVHKGSLLKNRGTEVPCLIRWPDRIKPGVRCDELVQNTDFVPTWFDIANIELPAGYRIDGISIAPLFNDPEQPIRQYVYGEMGPARSIKTKDWNYIALRYTSEQIESIRNARGRSPDLPEVLDRRSPAAVETFGRPHARGRRPAHSARSVKQLMGLSGGVSRARTRPHAFDVDQLYDLQNDPEEISNVASVPTNRRIVRQMKRMLKQELERFPDRPYGEFIPGQNAVPGNEQKDLARLLRVIAAEAN